ncbi:MAG TPA: HD domain-containing phosphohydrolase [Gemmatimonadota bacterium]|nr:HD domain-containing phosphohydrolase [Gemmatimonadota bacterium]
MKKRLKLLSSSWALALTYLLVGVAWMLLSHRVAHAFASNPSELARWQSYKGWIFVLGSAVLIYALSRSFRRSGRDVRTMLARGMDLLPDPAVVRRVADDTYLLANRAYLDLLGRSRGEIEGRSAKDLGVEFLPEDWSEYGRRLHADGLVRDFPLHVTLPDGSRHLWLASSAREELGGTKVIIATTKDVTELEEARLQAESQVRRIQSLREIDLAITASLDLRVTLRVVLDQVLEQLNVDAAAILLLGNASQEMEFAAGRGFRTRALRHTTLRLGEGYAGEVARTRSTCVVPDLSADPDRLARSRELEDEGFVSYAAVALVAKGRVNGVLEVFSRRPLDAPEEWRDFLEVLAGQAAIAVDSASLFANLQRSNDRLREAYEQTIEGWARALALRDQETFGHTERVTEVTSRLARRRGLSEEDLVHVRRGALLHDIGKVGVPDRILLKPGSLDEEEWEVMKRHPALAYEILCSIDHLRRALDIPYCHHERWDGSGYPRGLEGPQIPRAARIFAVVDVWDALRSERPYRKAWSVEKTLSHIREESGSHFQPEIVDAFLDLHAKEQLELLRDGGHRA